jgi:Zn2+/Cd2+-exporting ATPase
MKKRYDIRNLTCVSCALEIENQIANLNGINFAKIDFTAEKLIIEGENLNITDKELQKVARSIEEGVSIKEEHTFEKDIEQSLKITRLDIIFYGTGVFLLLLGYVFQLAILTDFKFFLIIPIYIASYIIFGGKVLKRAFINITKFKFFDEHLLMTLATVGAFFLMEFVEGILVMLFYRVGEYLQERSVSKSRNNIKKLVDITPTIAHIMKQNAIYDVDPRILRVGEIISVRPGERVPVDGIVIEGSSWLDTSVITGESLPKDVYEGLEVVSGSINISGLIQIQVMKTYENSTVAKILAFIENSPNKAKTEQFITRFAKYYTPIVVLIAVILAFIVPVFVSLLTGTTYLEELIIYFERALVFLVISCPCALVLSIPLSFFSGIGASSKNGILFKSGIDLENMSQIDHFVFDKTGTLTEGKFKLFQTVSGEPELILEYAAHAEYHSNHPIARSVIEAYGKELDTKSVDSIREIAGKGVIASYKGVDLLVGNHKLLDSFNIKYLKTHEIGTILYVVANKEFLGYLVIKDTIRESSYKLIKDLKKKNKNITMITGDNQNAAMDISYQLKIEDYYANCLPEDKIHVVEELMKENKVCFVGDGINDAPVLMKSYVGIAMGGIGSDIAIEAADVVIMNDDPYQVKIAHQIAKKTMRIVKQNIVLALGIKILVMILGAFGFISLWLAIFADVGVSILAVFNALRIFRVKK